jgi:hypothetical protein
MHCGEIFPLRIMCSAFEAKRPKILIKPHFAMGQNNQVPLTWD